jgi:hypothetical protein
VRGRESGEGLTGNLKESSGFKSCIVEEQWHEITNLSSVTQLPIIPTTRPQTRSSKMAPRIQLLIFMIASIIFHDFPLDIDYVVASDIPEIAAKKLDRERLEIGKKNAVCKCDRVDDY